MSKRVNNDYEHVEPFDTVINFDEDFNTACVTDFNGDPTNVFVTLPESLLDFTKASQCNSVSTVKGLPSIGFSKSVDKVIEFRHFADSKHFKKLSVMQNSKNQESLPKALEDGVSYSDKPVLFRLDKTLPINESDAVLINTLHETESHSGTNGDSRNNQENCTDELMDLRQKLAARVEEVSSISQELMDFKNEKRQFEIRLSELSKHGSIKAETILSLRTKIAELYADNECLQCAHSQALDNLTDLQQNLSELKKSRDLLAEQLRNVEFARHRLQAESESSRVSLKEGGELNHRLAHENACLQAQLVCSRASLADTKRNLTRQLESLRMDIIEREVIFERINAERASFEYAIEQRTNQINDLQRQISSLKMDLKTTQEQLEFQQNKLRLTDACLKETEQKRDELQEKLDYFQQQYHIKKDQLDEEISKHNTVLDRLKHLDGDYSDANLKLKDATEKIATLTASLSVVQQEKDALDVYLTDLKNNLNRVEGGFSKLKYELDAKCAQITELTNQCNSRSQKIVDLEKQLCDSCCLTDALKQEKEDLVTSINSLQFESMKYLSKPGQSLNKSDISVQTFDREPYIRGSLCKGPVNIAIQTATQTDDPRKYGFNLSYDSAFFEDRRSDDLSVSVSMDYFMSPKSLLDPYTNSSPKCIGNGVGYAVIDPRSDSVPYDTVHSDLPHIMDSRTNPSHTYQTIAHSQCSSQEWQSPFVTIDNVVAPSKVDSRLVRSEWSHSEQTNHVSRSLTRPNVECEGSSKLITSAQTELSSYFNQMTDESNNLDIDFLNHDFETSKTDAQVVYAVPDSSCLIDQGVVSPGPCSGERMVSQNHLSCSKSTLTELNSDELNMLLAKNEYSKTVLDDLKKLEYERETLSLALSTNNRQLADAMTDISALRKELEYKSRIIEHELEAHQKATEAYQATMEELTSTRLQLEELRTQERNSMLEAEQVKNELHVLRSRQATDNNLFTTELEAFKAIIKITTQHLQSMSQSLKKTEWEKQALQNELAQLKGGIRAQLEQFRLFTRLDTPDTCLFPISETAHSVCSTLSTLGIDISKLDSLLGEDAKVPLLYSKPLHNLDKVFESMQAEITNLEKEVIHHAMCVHDSSGSCRYLGNNLDNFEEFVQCTSKPIKEEC